MGLVLKEFRMSPYPLGGIIGSHGDLLFFWATKFPAMRKSYVNMEFLHGSFLF